MEFNSHTQTGRITLEEYVRMGGKLENLDCSKASTTYLDAYKGLPIQSIVKGATRTKSGLGDSQLYMVNFENGLSHRYSGIWIEIFEVKIILDTKYTK